MGSKKALTILAVEDNPDTQTLLQYMLRPYTLVFTGLVDDALEKADQQRFDLFLLDINLGEQRSGLDLLKLLRERPAYAQTPALAVTAYAMPGDRDRFLAAGFNGYISKPFTRRDLMEAIETVTSNAEEQA